MYCRVPMPHGGTLSLTDCPKRNAREEDNAASVGLDQIREIGKKMTRDVTPHEPKKRQRATAKHK
jgi:hypothetical protein